MTQYPYITRKSSFAIVCNNLNAKTINAHGISYDSTVKRGSLCRYAIEVNGKYVLPSSVYLYVLTTSPLPYTHRIFEVLYMHAFEIPENLIRFLSACVSAMSV